jgi:(1->4)-alpha-D-glucan 1-alpha-D-glucosylmutase
MTARRGQPRGVPAPAPQSTYRLQLQPGFGFTDAARIAGYLAALGVTHAYLSPILQTVPGSVHGYDVVDHSRLSTGLGGEGAFRDMVGSFRRHGLAVIADIVPNHMAIGPPESLNRQFWSVLRDGPGSAYAHWFDVDWQAQRGRLLLPVLAGPLGDCLADLSVDHGGPEGAVLRYHEHVLPVRPGTEDLPLADLADAQHYRLAGWRTAATELNWRRFFDVTSLIAVRVEDEDVFAATHGLLLSLMAEGLIDGLRVDHPDGLADPRGYLDRLAKATGGAWVACEKILTGAEELPAEWKCAGTTGYDALARIGGVFLDPAGAGPLTAQYAKFTGGTTSFAAVAETAKRQVTQGSLAAEVRRLARLLARCDDPALRGLAARDRRRVVAELLTAVPVYRAYVVPGEPPPATSAAIVGAAAAQAKRRLPARLHPVLAAVAALALGRAGEAGGWRDGFVVRFQQTCGPVMAKGVEDTAFYRWSRLVALNEVGGEPDSAGTQPEAFHEFAGRLARDWPATLTTLSTHDTKRQEDVRARLAVLAEIPEEWAAEVTRWHDAAAALSGGGRGARGREKQSGGGRGAGAGQAERGGGTSGARGRDKQNGSRLPDPDTEYLMWQTLVGAWPVSADRAAEYLTKAMREAKTATSWQDPDEDYEAGVLRLAAAVLGDAGLAAAIAGFAARIAADARVNSLGAKLVQLTMPGAADVYQGCELGGFALVDPDNRRLVDYSRRWFLLAAQDAGGPGVPPDLDTEKLLVTSRALRLRREHPDWFTGGYAPVRATGPAAGHVIAFQRGGHAITVAARLPVGLHRRGGWAATALRVPLGRWRDVLTGATHSGPRLLLSDIEIRLPVALLVPADA